MVERQLAWLSIEHFFEPNALDLSERAHLCAAPARQLLHPVGGQLRTPGAVSNLRRRAQGTRGPHVASSNYLFSFNPIGSFDCFGWICCLDHLVILSPTPYFSNFKAHPTSSVRQFLTVGFVNEFVVPKRSPVVLQNEAPSDVTTTPDVSTYPS